jgi:ribosomal protein S18 acetylase RimI-like enzyme
MATGWNEAEKRQLHGKRFAAQEFRVIQASGADVGILALGREPDCVKVNQLFILPKYQGRRIGELCMQRVIDDAGRTGLPIRLRVLKMNPRAIAFFRRLGFKSEGESETHVFMEKPIVRKGSSQQAG